MDEGASSIATAVLHLMKRSLKRIYTLLIIFIILFCVSMIDSIYQRCRIINILNDLEVVEETENYEIEQESGDNGNNNFISGNGNELNNG